MRTILFFPLLLVSLLAISFRCDAAPWNQPEIQRLLQERVDKKEAVGIVIGLVDDQGSQILTRGKASREGTPQLDGDTVFEIGSVTKVFTATLLADAVVHHQLSLQDPIEKFLGGTAGVPARNGQHITLLHLATHTSGLPRNHPGYTGLDENYTPNQYAQFLSNFTLTRDIGSAYEYSNWGYALLGNIVANQSGLDYESLVVKRICDPLQMNSTRVTISPEMTSRLAVGYTPDDKPLIGRKFNTYLSGIGGLKSTANDLMRFLSANMGLTKTDMTEAMQGAQRPQHKTDSNGVWTGLGWQLFTSRTPVIIGHGGATNSYRSFVGFIPGEHKGIVALTNTTYDVQNLSLHILDPTIPLAPEPPMAEVDPAVYDAYAGQYELGPGKVVTITREDDKLVTQVTGQPKIEVLPESETKYFNALVKVEFVFVRNAQGEVTRLLIHQHGREWIGNKIH